jgi:glutathione S-transferase
MIKPIILYGHGPTPNPIKVAILLEELGVPYELKSLDFKTELKSEPYISINPNGRVPSIEDPNTGVNLFEVLPVNFPVLLTNSLKCPVWCHHRIPHRNL